MKQLTLYMLHRSLQKEDTRSNLFLGENQLARKYNETIGLNLAAKQREYNEFVHCFISWGSEPFRNVNPSSSMEQLQSLQIENALKCEQ